MFDPQKLQSSRMFCLLILPECPMGKAFTFRGKNSRHNPIVITSA